MSFARSLAVLLILGLVGLVGYQIGISQQIATAAPGVAPVAYGYYPWHFGFGFFGLLFPLFFLFIFFGLLRAAIWGGRGWSGHSYSRFGRMQEMHEELHRTKADQPSGGASSGPSGTAT